MTQNILDLWLKHISVEGGIFAHCLFGKSFDMTIHSADTQLIFHLVTQGDSQLTWSTGHLQHEAHLKQGDIVLLQADIAHMLSSTGKQSCESLVLERDYIEGFKQITLGESGCELLCGYFDISQKHLQRLLGDFPPVIILRCNHDTSQLHAIMRLLECEAQQFQAGSKTIMSRLTQTMFLYILRAWTTQYPHATGLAAAASDPLISKALVIMHQDLQQAWTIESLAQQVHASRANFARRFSKLLGIAPMEYLTDLRIQEAARLLVTAKETVDDIAEQVGYRSEAAFIKVFKKQMGLTPSKYRQQFSHHG